MFAPMLAAIATAAILWLPYYWCCCEPSCPIAPQDLNLDRWVEVNGIAGTVQTVTAHHDPDGGGTGIPVWSTDCFLSTIGATVYIKIHLGCAPGICLRSYGSDTTCTTVEGFAESLGFPASKCSPTVVAWALQSASYNPTDILFRSTAPGSTVAYIRFYE